MLRVWISTLIQKLSRFLVWFLVPPNSWEDYHRCLYVAPHELGRCVLRQKHWGWHRTFPDNERNYPIAW
jgi:hypothetical protein